MLIYLDTLSGGEVASDSYDTKLEAKKGIMILESKWITEGGEVINVGGNASAEGGDEEVDDDVVRVLNIVSSHQLVKFDIGDKKELKTLLKTMWAKVVKKLKARQIEAAGFEDDYKLPKDKKEAAAALAEAREELADPLDVKAYDEITARLALFEKRYKSVTTWIKKNVVDCFSDCDFYFTQGADYGEGIVIPAKYIGESSTPSFIVFVDAVDPEKA